MVNGNVLERGKRDKLGHRGSNGLAGPQPAPLGYSPVMGGGLLATPGGAPGALPSPGSWSTELPAPPASQFGSCPVAMSWEWQGPSWARSAPNLGWRGCVQGSHWKRFNATRGSAPGCGGTGAFQRGFGVTSAGRLQKAAAFEGCHSPEMGCDGCWHPASGVGCRVPRHFTLPSAGSRGPKRWVVSLCCLLVQPLPDLRMAEVKFSLFTLEKKRKEK